MSDSIIKDLLTHSVHVGHKQQYWNPRMRKNIYGVQNHIHVFDLHKTEKKMQEMKKILTKFSEQGKEILIIGTKVQARELVKNIALETGHMYITNKWAPGLLTNFFTLKKRIFTYKKILSDQKQGHLARLSKKEQAEKLKILERLEKYYEGIIDIRRLPDAVFVIDGHYESLPLKEAKTLGIPAYGILGTTGNPDMCEAYIPGNVNSLKSLQYMMEYLRPAFGKPSKKLQNKAQTTQISTKKGATK